jgi:hypothetical protein
MKRQDIGVRRRERPITATTKSREYRLDGVFGGSAFSISELQPRFSAIAPRRGARPWLQWSPHRKLGWRSSHSRL